jgi:hypothetical protein
MTTADDAIVPIDLGRCKSVAGQRPASGGASAHRVFNGVTTWGANALSLARKENGDIHECHELKP